MTEQPVETAVPVGRSSAAREFFALLRKGAKTISMYRHNAARFAEFLKPAHDALAKVLEPGPLVVKVSAEAFLVEEQEAWASEGGENVPLRLYREGIRQLVLRPGMTEDELGKLVMILLTPTERTGEEIISQLWAASFEHLDYVAVDGFRVDEMSESEVQVEVDRLVDYLAARLRGDTDDVVAFARISAADLELKLEGIEQLRGAIFDEQGVAEAFKGRLQSELQRDEREKLPARLTALAESVLRDGAEPAPLLELFTNLIDGALLAEDLGPVVRVLDALGRVAAAAGPGEAAAQSIQLGLAERMADDSRLRRLGDVIRHQKALDPAAVGRYLGAIRTEGVPALLDVLETLELGPIRTPFVDALARLAPEKPELLAARLENATSASVRDLVAILLRGNFPDAARYLQAAMRNPNPQVKVGVLSEMGACKKPELVHRFVLEGSVDKNGSVRAAAFKAMAQVAPGRAVTDLLRLPKLPDWDKRDAAERELIHVCLGQTQREEALFYLQQLLMQKKSLLNGKKVVEAKLQAVAGLQAMATLHAFKILQGVAADPKEDAEVTSAARRAMYAVKKLLVENAAQPGRPKSDNAAPTPEVAAAAADALYDQFQTAQKHAPAGSAAEKARIAAAMKAREEAEAAEAARKEAERQEAMKRPFGLDPGALAALVNEPPAKPPPLPTRPPTGATRIADTGPGALSPHVAATQPRVAATQLPNTSPRIDASGKVIPPAPPPSEDVIELDIDVEGEGG